MIPVTPQPEPATFDKKVRQPGLKWLAKRNISLNHPLPKKTEPENYWTKCLDDLHSSYSGICAYLCIYIERVFGVSTDHFIAKSKDAGQIYEWSNYRLACSTLNSKKRDYDDVLDPFLIRKNMFYLELVSGRIYPNPRLSALRKKAVEETIKRLKLDDGNCRLFAV